MLNLLENPLGLTRVAPSAAERIVQMRGCLAAACTGSRFYENSFTVDEFGTAAAILAWRDQWLEHGWDGAAPGESGSRLKDMAAIDRLARASVFPGLGERLADVATLLEVRRPPLESIELTDPLSEFPVTWRRVLAQLPTTASAGMGAAPAASAGTMLHGLQTAALALHDGRAAEKLRWRDDGSLRIVRAESTLAAAQWLAADCRAAPQADRVFVIEREGAVVDACFAAMDLPLLGCSEPSAFRPTLQLLPLVVRLLWEPLDFKALLQFLTHPVGPIRGFARHTLAQKMAEYPGIGGAAWNTAIASIAAHYGDDGHGVVAEIAFWLEGERFSAHDLAPLELVQARVERLAQFYLQRLADADPLRRASWAVGHAQADAAVHALQALQRQGVRRLAADTLDRIVSQATAQGSDNPLLDAQAKSNAQVGSASALIEAFDEVCWWRLAAVQLTPRYPWSPKELAELRAIGVELPPLSQILAREARGWLRPVLAARKRLTLLLPGAGEEVHPVWLSLSSLLDSPPIIEVERVLADGGSTGDGAGVTPVPHRPLPHRRRWFHIPPGAIHGWDRAASFSSLDQFFNNPFQWALNYPAQLKPSSLLDIPDDFRLLGNLAHRVVERLYRNLDALQWTNARVLAWFDQTVDRIVREEGAVLLMSGRRADLESFRLRFRRSLARLHAYLAAAGAAAVEPEKPLSGSTPLGTLRGSSDLLVSLRDGRRVIIDMKWAGNKKYREKLTEQTHTQLAIYARLVESNTNAWPAVAYFILRDPELLTTDDGVFPGVTPIRVQANATALLWDRITATWAWRRAQIEAGSLEFPMDDLEPTDQSNPPPGALAIEPVDQRHSACAHLAGWEPDA